MLNSTHVDASHHSMSSPLSHEHFDDADDLFGSSDSEDQVQAAITSPPNGGPSSSAAAAARLMLPTGSRRGSSAATPAASAATGGAEAGGEAARTRSSDPSLMVKSPTHRVRNSLSPNAQAQANPEHAPPLSSSSSPPAPPTGTDVASAAAPATKKPKRTPKAKPAPAPPAWPTRSRSGTPLPPARFAPPAPAGEGEATQSALASEMRSEARRKKRTVLEAATTGDVELTQRAKRQRLAAAEKSAQRSAASSSAVASPSQPQQQQQAQEARSVIRADGTLDLEALIAMPADEDFFDPLNALASTALAAGPAPPSGTATPGALHSTAASPPAFSAAPPASNMDLLAQALAMANDAQSQAPTSAAAAPGTSMEELLGIDAPWLSDPLAALPDAAGSLVTSAPASSSAGAAKASPMPYDDSITRAVRRGARSGGAAKSAADETLKRALAQRDETPARSSSPAAPGAAEAGARPRRRANSASSRRRNSRSASGSASASPPHSDPLEEEQEDGEPEEKSEQSAPPKALAKKLAPVLQKMPKHLSGAGLRAAVLERVAARRASSSSSSSSRSPSAPAAPRQAHALSTLLTRRIEAAEAAQEKLTGSLFRLKVDQHVLASARHAVDERIVAIGQERLEKSAAMPKRRAKPAAEKGKGKSATPAPAPQPAPAQPQRAQEEEAPPMAQLPPLHSALRAKENVDACNVFDKVVAGGFEAETHLSDGLY